MPFNTTTLANTIAAKMDELRSNETDPAAANDALAAAIASAVAAQVVAMFTDATIFHVPVLVAPPGGGPVTGAITTTISITVV